MASQAVDLGPFAPEQGATSRWAAAGAALGAAAAGLAGVSVLIDALGPTDLRTRSYSAPLGAAALLVSLGALYHVSAFGLSGRRLARLGAFLGVGGAMTGLIHGAVQEGVELKEFGFAYFDREVMAAIWRDILNAGVNTLKYALIAQAFAIVFGLFVAMLVLSKRRRFRLPATAFVDVVRGLPLLMLIMLMYFGPTYIGVSATHAFTIAALAMNSSAYVAEIFRAGIQSVDKGQMDAARSLGMPYATSMVQVVIPQAFRKVIPPLTNEFISLVKDTSLLIIVGATVSQRELLGAARQLSATTFSATPFMTASIAYLVITLPLIQIVRRLEQRYLSGDERLRFQSVQEVGGRGGGGAAH